LRGYTLLCTIRPVTSNELKRWLQKHGCQFLEGKKHTLAYYLDRFAPIPRHGKKELPKGTVEAIKRQLGLQNEKE